METPKTAGAFERRVMRNIQTHAKRLARSNAVPGMDVQDYEQDLAADLVQRQAAFNPLIASFATFADRIIGHRASTLRTPTAWKNAERSMLSLDAPLSVDGEELTLHDILPDPMSPGAEWVALGLDVRRFLDGLGKSEWQTCALLLDDSIAEGARRAGIHRSTAYEHIDRLRNRAMAAGLGDYVVESPDSSGLRTVGDQQACAIPTEAAMLVRYQPVSPRLFITDPDFCRWLSEAVPGQTLEYFRGFLAIDRDPNGCRLREEDPLSLIVSPTVLGPRRTPGGRFSCNAATERATLAT
ncbi:hypothetical protein [Rhodoplanes sp. Z2-YC6860]|uniref:hypothetical protein n=1 Tax=Rhodoplanes sp. Z2-YC6860 TaxID=674703 RepID=UPI0012ED291E|nr:hypothetical protein [Rhodoplanes sp. Z2-YC6860]